MVGPRTKRVTGSSNVGLKRVNSDVTSRTSSHTPAQSEGTKNAKRVKTNIIPPNQKTSPRNKQSPGVKVNVSSQVQGTKRDKQADTERTKALSIKGRRAKAVVNKSIPRRSITSSPSPTVDAELTIRSASGLEYIDGESTSESVEEPTQKSPRRKPRIYKKAVCKVCGHISSTSNGLWKHMFIHTGKRPFPCTVCTKTFRQSQDLKVHMRSHTGERPFSCSECGAKFTQKCALSAHERRHTGEKPYECPTCDQKFTNNSTLTRHMTKHSEEKNFICDVCGKLYKAQRDMMMHHRRVHLGVRQAKIKCSICGQGFQKKSDWKGHMEDLHKEYKPFSCEKCSEKFVCQSDVSKHVKRDHKVVREKKSKPIKEKKKPILPPVTKPKQKLKAKLPNQRVIKVGRLINGKLVIVEEFLISENEDSNNSTKPLAASTEKSSATNSATDSINVSTVPSPPISVVSVEDDNILETLPSGPTDYKYVVSSLPTDHDYVKVTSSLPKLLLSPFSRADAVDQTIEVQSSPTSTSRLHAALCQGRSSAEPESDECTNSQCAYECKKEAKIEDYCPSPFM